MAVVGKVEKRKPLFVLLLLVSIGGLYFLDTPPPKLQAPEKPLENQGGKPTKQIDRANALKKYEFDPNDRTHKAAIAYIRSVLKEPSTFRLNKVNSFVRVNSRIGSERTIVVNVYYSASSYGGERYEAKYRFEFTANGEMISHGKVKYDPSPHN